MRNLAKVLLVMVASFFFGCASEKTKETALEKHTVTIINFGVADSAFNQVNTNGFGINNYTFIDLNTDSVFTRQKYELDEPIRVKIKAGFLKNLGENDTILKGIAALQILPKGFIKGTETKDHAGLLYCGPHVYLEHQFGKEKRYYFYTHFELDSTIENMSDLLLSLSSRQSLNDLNLNNEFNEDRILEPILSLKGMQNFSAPPIRTKATIKFMPPVKGYEKNSANNPNASDPALAPTSK